MFLAAAWAACQAGVLCCIIAPVVSKTARPASQSMAVFLCPLIADGFISAAIRAFEAAFATKRLATTNRLRLATDRAEKAVEAAPGHDL